jgi:VCBS repeat-containing protein
LDSDDSANITANGQNNLILKLGGGNDTTNVALTNQLGDVEINAGQGDDVTNVTADFSGSGTKNLVLKAGLGNDTVEAAIKGANTAELRAGAGDDDVNLAGSTGTIQTFLGQGNDTFSGGSSSDIVYGGTGDDVFNITNFAQDGAGDIFIGGQDSDTININGTRDDYFVEEAEFSTGDGNTKNGFKLSGINAPENAIFFKNVETFTFSDSGETLSLEELLASNPEPDSAPTVTLVTPAENLTIDEDTSLSLELRTEDDVNVSRVVLEISDENAGDYTFSNVPAGVTFVEGDGSNDTRTVVEGDTASINELLASINYNLTPDYFGNFTISITATDNTGNEASLDVPVVVNGTPDAAVIAGTSTGAASEDGTLTANGTLTITDVDGAAEETFAEQTDVAGAYGTFSVNAAGEWNYALDNAASAVQALAEGETAQETFTVTSADGTTQNVVVNVTGTNDAAVIAGTSTGAASEDGTLTANGTLTITDVDGAAEETFAEQTDVAGAYGTFSVNAAGEWNYALDNAASAVQALAEGETAQETFTVTSADGTTQNVVVNVTGANDAPIANADSTSTDEDVAVTVDVLANDTDPENDALTIDSTTQGEHGSVSIVDNKILYTPDADFNGQDSFTYIVKDETGLTSTATANVTVNAINDAPTDISVSNLVVDENVNGALIGAVSATDIDTGDSHTFEVLEGGATSTRFEVVGGELKLIDGVSLDFETEAEVDITVRAADQSGLTFDKLVTISVNDDAGEGQVINGTNASFETLIGGIGDDTINSFNGQDVLDGREGDDILTGGLGQQRFIVGVNAGDNDIITNFQTGLDLIDLTAFTNLSSLGDLTMSQQGADVVIDLGNGQDLTLQNVQVGDLRTNNFVDFTEGGSGGGDEPTEKPDNGVAVTEATEGDDTINDQNGNDHVDGLGGRDTFNITSEGQNIFIGGAGQDNFDIEGFTFEGDGTWNWIDGGDDDDNFQVQGGNNTIIGGEGRDSFFITDNLSGSNTLIGGAGDDRFEIYGGRDHLIFGSDGRDTIEVRKDIDRSTIDGGAGNDYINVRGGEIELFAGAGNDVIFSGSSELNAFGNGIKGASNHTISGGAGEDEFNYVRSDAFNDVITDFDVNEDRINLINFSNIGIFSDLDLEDQGNSVQVNFSTVVGGRFGYQSSILLEGVNISELNHTHFDGVADDGPINGTSGDDRLIGTDVPELFNGLEGNDDIEGNAGEDTIHGDEGDDTLNGGRDNDTIYGGTGNDHINGAGGNNRLYGGDGDDHLSSNAAFDNSVYNATNVYEPGAGDDRVNLNYGSNTIKIEKNAGDNDTIQGFDVNTDQISLINLTPRETVTTVNFENGNTLIDFGDSQTLLITGLSQADFNEHLFDTVFPFGVNLEGTEGNDLLTGGNRSDTLSGNGGNDHLIGKDGIDQLNGGEGADLLMGNKGNDTLKGDAGNATLFGDNNTNFHIVELGADILYGGDGNDYLAGGSYNDTLYGGEGDDVIYGEIDLSNGAQMSGGDLIYGDAGNDRIDGGRSTDVIYGGIGDDTLYGGLSGWDAQGDTLNGGDGNDLLFANNGNALGLVYVDASLLNGDAGNDTLYGGSGDDTLYGGADNDHIHGSRGSDQLFGDAGADTFVFRKHSESLSETDIVRDFNSSEDILDFTTSVTRTDDLTYGTLDATTASTLGVAAGSAFIDHSDGLTISGSSLIVVLDGVGLGELIPDLNIIA